MSVPKTKQMVASDVAPHSTDFSFGIPLVFISGLQHFLSINFTKEE